MNHNKYYFCPKKEALFISIACISLHIVDNFEAINKRCKCSQKELIDIFKRLNELDIFISSKGFFCLVDKEFLVVEHNKLRCMLKNDTDVALKTIAKILDLFHDFGTRFLDVSSSKLKEILVQEMKE